MSVQPASAPFVACALFDIDGTLSDTDILHREIFQDFLKQYGYDCDDEFFRTRISGRANHVIAADLMPQIPVKEAERIFAEKEQQFRDLAETRLKPVPGLIELLDHLKREKIPIAAVTNAPRANADMMLRVLNIRHYFEHVVIGDECEASKPSPIPYQVGMKLLNVTAADRSLVFEDSLTGVKAGVDAGCIVIGIRTTQPGEKLMEIGCHSTIGDYTELDLTKLTHYGKDFVKGNEKK